MRRGRLSAELHDVLRCVSSMRPSTVVLTEERREARTHRVRVLRSGGCANRRGTLVDELGLQRGRHRRSRTRRRQRGGANVQRESGRGDDGQHFRASSHHFSEFRVRRSPFTRAGCMCDAGGTASSQRRTAGTGSRGQSDGHHVAVREAGGPRSEGGSGEPARWCASRAKTAPAECTTGA